MSPFRRIVAELKKQERRLVAQLTSIRTAIASLEFGGGGVPAGAIIETPHAVRLRSKARRRGKMSAAAGKAGSPRTKKDSAARR